eukprot:3484465-Rhodomonas_salina.1
MCIRDSSYSLRPSLSRYAQTDRQYRTPHSTAHTVRPSVPHTAQYRTHRTTFRTAHRTVPHTPYDRQYRTPHAHTIRGHGVSVPHAAYADRA